MPLVTSISLVKVEIYEVSQNEVCYQNVLYFVGTPTLTSLQTQYTDLFSVLIS